MPTKNQIKIIRSLADKKGRAEHGLFVVEGEKLITEIVRSSLEIEEIFRVNENCLRMDMERMSSLKVPTRELAVVRIPQFDFAPSAWRLALDGVQDPGNVGSILRTADWFGINTVYASTDSADCFNPKVVQATMGAISRVRVEYCSLAERLEREKLPVYGTFLERSANIYSIENPQAGILVFGSEGRGISPEVERLVGERVMIPCAGGGESLNVAAAAAICTALLCRGV